MLNLKNYSTIYNYNVVKDYLNSKVEEEENFVEQEKKRAGSDL